VCYKLGAEGNNPRRRTFQAIVVFAAAASAAVQEHPIADLAVIVCVAFDHRASPDGLSKFKDCIERCPFVDTALEVSGTYDLIVKGTCASFAEYNEQMEHIRPHIAEFAVRLEPNFISKTIERNVAEDKNDALWLPCEGGHRQVQASMIDKVEADGDYMRVYVGDWNCLVHVTMHRLSDRLLRSGFIRLHRSSLVRISFIDRLVQNGQCWTARLRDGSHMSVAKSEVHRVRQLMMAKTSNSGTTRPNTGSRRRSRVTPSVM
jgi:DNA-binding Lrp family transcriptional regulator